MALKNIVRELKEMRDGIGNISRRGWDSGRHNMRRRGRAYIAPEGSSSSSTIINEQSQWANIPPELLFDIIQRIEASQTSWPARRDVVACASVCKSWRVVTKEIVRTPEQCSLLSFPISLKQPGPRDAPIQCFIRRERPTGIYRLYLGLSPALSGDMSKLLLTARKIRKAMSTDFVISLVGDDFSRASNTYVGKLRSNFLGTKFTIYDSQRPRDSPILSNSSSHRKNFPKQASSSGRSHQKIFPKQASSNGSTSTYSVATISYELNVLRTRGPRRMQCTMYSIPISAIQEGGAASTPMELANCRDEQFPSLPLCKGKKPLIEFSSASFSEPLESFCNARDPMVLNNKAPRWHEHLQCWCLNFKGRVTVASVKNFQLVATAEPCQNVPVAEQEKVILQFGKIGKDIFTMDYRYPLSAFQAFAICLSSFDTKPACE